MPPQTRNQTAREVASTSDAQPSTIFAEQSLESNGVRLRNAESTSFAINEPARAPSRASTRNDEPDELPRFTVDLSLPPEQRYLGVCAAMKDEMLGLTLLFDDVVGGIVDFIPIRWLHFICRLLLRRVYDDEENAELRGISKAIGVDMFLLVCFNVLLDLFMGCSSGGAAIRAHDKEGREESKMVHFRTLDWGMPSLRRVVVQLDYVSEKDGPIVASSITYAGFVGVLTGVRKDLSMSLNFRPNRVDNGQFIADAKYVWHLLMVLLGKRPSISSHLRRSLLPQRQKIRRVSWFPFFTKAGDAVVTTYPDLVRQMGGDGAHAAPLTTTACYLCFSNGAETTVIEKDRATAIVRSGTDFVIVTNADETTVTEELRKENPALGLAEIVDEAQNRQQCARNNWNNMRHAESQRKGAISDADMKVLLGIDDVVEMVQKYPTTNECTHFACVMDPQEGVVAWCRRWKKPIGAKWIRAHMSDTW